MTLLQASAGTGKTFTIAALTTRYVAEAAVPIDRLLVITFTRMATGELRERVRDRLVLAFDGLVDILEGRATHEDDEVVRHLAERLSTRGRGAAGPFGQGDRGLRRSNDRDDARILSPGALRPRDRR